jgi:hypothetical protein
MEVCKQRYLPFFRAYWDIYRLPAKSNMTMVIVEPRLHKDLEFVIKNTAYFCPGWSLYVFVSNQNLEMVKAILGHNASRANIIVFTEGNITIDQYNAMLTTRRFWDIIEADNILMFQTDTIVRRFGIEKYCIYDYIGAPWPHLNNTIGNGGLSIRRKAALIEAIDNQTPEINEHEDLFFARWNYRPGSTARLPSIETATEFSVENIDHPNPWGAHQIWKWDAHPAYQKLLCEFDLVRSTIITI